MFNVPEPIDWAEGECWLKCDRNAYVPKGEVGAWSGAVGARLPLLVL